MFSVMLFGNLAMCYDIASPFSAMIDLNLLEFTSEIVISIPICSMVLEYLPTFSLKVTQLCR